MIYEIVYTSAPSGLRPGSSGYCTVQSSRGIPEPTVKLMESLSGYRHLHPAGSSEAKGNPVNFGHYLLRSSGQLEHILSRVSDCDLDYSGRSNKLAHHLMLTDPTVYADGPAALLQRSNLMISQWNGDVGFLNRQPPPPEPSRPRKCRSWKQATGDAGWAGVVAQSFLDDPERRVFLICRPDTDLLSLFDEAIRLLPENCRWDVTFATFGAALPSTVETKWSGIISGTTEESTSRRHIHALRIDLTRPMPPAEGGRLVELARSGRPAETPPVKPKAAAPVAAKSGPAPERPAKRVPKKAASRSSESPERAAPPPPPPVRRRQSFDISRYLGWIVAACLLVGILVVLLVPKSPESQVASTDTSTDATTDTAAATQDDAAEATGASGGTAAGGSTAEGSDSDENQMKDDSTDATPEEGSSEAGASDNGASDSDGASDDGTADEGMKDKADGEDTEPPPDTATAEKSPESSEPDSLPENRDVIAPEAPIELSSSAEPSVLTFAIPKELPKGPWNNCELLLPASVGFAESLSCESIERDSDDVYGGIHIEEGGVDVANIVIRGSVNQPTQVTVTVQPLDGWEAAEFARRLRWAAVRVIFDDSRLLLRFTKTTEVTARKSDINQMSFRFLVDFDALDLPIDPEDTPMHHRIAFHDGDKQLQLTANEDQTEFTTDSGDLIFECVREQEGRNLTFELHSPDMVDQHNSLSDGFAEIKRQAKQAIRKALLSPKDTQTQQDAKFDKYFQSFNLRAVLEEDKDPNPKTIVDCQILQSSLMESTATSESVAFEEPAVDRVISAFIESALNDDERRRLLKTSWEEDCREFHQVCRRLQHLCRQWSSLSLHRATLTGELVGQSGANPELIAFVAATHVQETEQAGAQ